MKPTQSFEEQFPSLIAIGIQDGDGLVFSQVHIAKFCLDKQKVRDAITSVGKRTFIAEALVTREEYEKRLFQELGL